MKKTLRVVVLAALAAAVSILSSCAKPTHQVYFKVTGTSVSTDVDYAIYSSNGLLSSTLNSADTTVTSLPWSSETMTVSQDQVANVNVYISDAVTSSPSVTVQIYSDGSVVKSASCTGNNSSASARVTF